MKHIYISPHADDVALSCGGQIIANSNRRSDTLVLTVFTSEAPDTNQESDAAAPFYHSLNSSRNLEDSSAWQKLGIKADYLNLPEALLRKTFPFQIFSYKKVDEIVEQLCDAIGSFIALYPDSAFYFPAGFGNHVDHLACRRAAFRLLDQGILDKITLYEDIPYCWLRFLRMPYYKVLLRNVKLAETSLARASRPSGLPMLAYLRQKLVPFPQGRKLFVAVRILLFIEQFMQKFSVRKRIYDGTICLIGLSNEQILQKQALLFQYKSQIPMLFGAYPNRLLNRYAKSFATEVVIEIAKSGPQSYPPPLKRRGPLVCDHAMKNRLSPMSRSPRR